MENSIFLERYRLSLGRNGLPVEMHRSPSARTYRAQEIETGREVALTLVSTASSDPVVLKRLEAEALAAEKINHINIPRLYDFGLENDELIYVSEYCEGHTASTWVGARGPLSTAAVLRVALQVVDAMNATAFQHLYHPALNPDNLLFIAGQTVEGDWPPIKVLHWYGSPPSFAQKADARAESAARFAAPEQLNEGKVDVRSEIYALGATMWFLLTGAPPAADGPGKPKAEMSKLRGAPKIVRHLLARMLRRNPLERPQDPVALANYLQACLARVERRAKIERRFGIPLSTQPRMAAPAAPVVRTPIPLKPLAIAAAILLLAALAVLFVPWSSTTRRSQSSAKNNRVPTTLPDDVPVVEKDSLGRIDAFGRNLPPAEVAAAPQVPGAESASPAPPSVTAASSIGTGNGAIPRDELATTEGNRAASEPPAPAEAPTENSRALVANRPANPPSEDFSPNESISQAIGAPPPVAKPNEPHSAVVVPTPAEVAGVTQAPEAKALPSDTPTATPRKNLLARHASTKPKTASLRDDSRTHVTKKRDRITRTAKRAHALPELRVGSSPAELVGTTRDGKWILSVAATGEKIIVPPPPGYGP